MLETLAIAAVHSDLRVDVHAAELGERACFGTHDAHGLYELQGDAAGRSASQLTAFTASAISLV